MTAPRRKFAIQTGRRRTGLGQVPPLVGIPQHPLRVSLRGRPHLAAPPSTLRIAQPKINHGIRIPRFCATPAPNAAPAPCPSAESGSIATAGARRPGWQVPSTRWTAARRRSYGVVTRVLHVLRDRLSRPISTRAIRGRACSGRNRSISGV
jgi:hypothetical protein